MHVIATAGHVDHGKSTLIRALTGMEPDRWSEERRRGMTIDLGYAWTMLTDGTPLAFVDVPGHHRFITNMLAGIGPVPAVLLVVAADEGWCRQTTEHLAALDALGVAHGVLAISRSDLGYPALAEEEARDHLAGTALADIEAVAVSPVAGSGLSELRDAIERMVRTLPPPSLDSTRLWIDRVFTIRGAGTVVTGTLGTGRISVGDELTVAPSGQVVQVRTVETLKRQVAETTAVGRVALNLRGAKREQLRRGDALVHPGEWTNTAVVDIRLTRTVDRLPTHLVFHVGSAAIPARSRRFDEHCARLVLGRPVPLHVGERAILRDPGRHQVVSGAVVLDVVPPPLTGRGAARARSGQLRTVDGEPDFHGEIVRRLVVDRALLRAAGVTIPESRPGVVEFGEWFVESRHWSHWADELAQTVRAWGQEHPLQPGMPRAAAGRALSLPDLALLDGLVEAVPGLIREHGTIRDAAADVVVPDRIRQALDALVARLTADLFDAPEAPELASAGLTEQYLATAAKYGRLVRVGAGVYLRPEALPRAVAVLAQLPQPFTVSQARIALGTTRRVAMPLLDLLDRRHQTRPVDAQKRREMCPSTIVGPSRSPSSGKAAPGSDDRQEN